MTLMLQGTCNLRHRAFLQFPSGKRKFGVGIRLHAHLWMALLGIQTSALCSMA